MELNLKNIEGLSAKDVGYDTNKDVLFKTLKGIYIKDFRSFKDRKIILGEFFTLITGKNGTMKSTLLGLLAHPFSSPNDARDLFGKPLKTQMRDVFRLSDIKDNRSYLYYILGETTNDDFIAEPVRIYPRVLSRDKEGDIRYRHRVTVGKDNSAGLGNFSLNTSYINLKRLYPIIDTAAEAISIELSPEERTFVSKAFARIAQRTEYKTFEPVSDDKIKYTCGPTNTFYNYKSISSGEDNLGTILYKLIAFQRNKDNNDYLQGLLCIDEIEASLHPVAQKYLLDFLFHWAKDNKIQIIATTHSLSLVEYYLDLQKKFSAEKASLINISTQQVGDDHNYKVMINPDFKTIYKELTYRDISESSYKVHILCEDEMAKLFLTRILKSKIITNNIDFIYNVGSDAGTSWNNYISLAKNAPNLLGDSIIIVDPDVPDAKISSAQSSFEYITKIPDPDNVPIEKRIAYYIYNLPGDDELFSVNEKMAFQGSMLEHHIDFENFKASSMTPFKNWRRDNKIFYNKALTRYINDNIDYFSSFKHKIIEYINNRRKNYGLAAIEL